MDTYRQNDRAQLDQRTALPDQCLHSAEADVRPQGGKSGSLRLFTIRGSFVSKKASTEAERANLEVTQFSLCALLAFVSTPV